eukprot:ANDGO_06739.mRNA.1 Bacteriohemerythrin
MPTSTSASDSPALDVTEKPMTWTLALPEGDPSHDLIKWGPSLELGVKMIDDQHKVLVTILNRIAEYLADGVEPWVVGVVIQELETYTHLHFSCEEQLMHRYGYKEEESHEKKHHWFIQQLREACERYKNGDSVQVVRELKTFLKDWLTTHILSSDRELAKFLNAKGVK